MKRLSPLLLGGCVLVFAAVALWLVLHRSSDRPLAPVRVATAAAPAQPATAPTFAVPTAPATNAPLPLSRPSSVPEPVAPAPVAVAAPTGTPVINGDLPPQARNMSSDEADAPGKATARIGDRTLNIPNHGGHYERALLPEGQAVQVNLAYPPEDRSTDVFAHAIQGGTINGKSAQRFDLSQNKTVSFDFAPDAEPGLYEVLLRRGAHEEVLQFWVPTKEPQHDPTVASTK